MRIQPFRAHIPQIDKMGVSPAHFARHIRDSFPEMIAKSAFQALPNEGFLICQIQTAEQKHTGFIALTAINDFIEGNIKKHEGILPEKEAHHKTMTLDRNGMIKPVLLAHWKSNRIKKLLTEITADQQPDFSFSFPEEAQTHAFWVVNTVQKMAAFESAMADIRYTFIADGHHRAASMATLYQETGDIRYKYLLSAYFAVEELKIHAYHRIFKYPHSDTRHFELLKSMSLLTLIATPALPNKRHQITLFYQGKWYKMRWRLPKEQRKQIDIALLNHFFFANCPEFDASTQLAYSEGVQSIPKIIEKTKDFPNAMIFFLPPIGFSDIKDIFRMGTIFPAKSTWFEPRIKSGLVTYLFDSPS
jgi:uncharacterized protein (DUF1015 family)